MLVGTEAGGTLLVNLFFKPMGMLFVPDSLTLDPEEENLASLARIGSFCGITIESIVSYGAVQRLA